LRIESAMTRRAPVPHAVVGLRADRVVILRQHRPTA
jgi:hypothetical protein